MSNNYMYNISLLPRLWIATAEVASDDDKHADVIQKLLRHPEIKINELVGHGHPALHVTCGSRASRVKSATGVRPSPDEA